MDLNRTENTTGPRSFSETAMLEALIPGFGFVSNILLTYLNFDIGEYIQAVVGIAVFATICRYVFQFLLNRFYMHCVSTAEIRRDDQMFNYLMYWIEKQSSLNRVPSFVAGVKSTRSLCDDEDTEMDNAASGIDFDTYWAQVVKRDKYRRIQFTPAEGSHYFWYKKRLVKLMRSTEEGNIYRYSPKTEYLYLVTVGRNPTFLKDLLQDAQRLYVERNGTKTIIERPFRFYAGDTLDWYPWMARVPRPLSTVILDQKQKDAFLNDVKEYLHPRTKRWYSNRGIPYRRGYLFHGPPGTGKTSLSFAVAGLLGLKIYYLDLNSRNLDEDSLIGLFGDLPNRCIVLLEDVDSAGITKSREEQSADDDNKSGDKGNSDANHASSGKEKGGITLSALLNVIDGVAATEGRILVMATNHPEKLDAALLRPGRVDMTIEFGNTSETDMKKMFTSMYATLEGDLAPEEVRIESNGGIASSLAGIDQKPSDKLIVRDEDQKKPSVRAYEIPERISQLADEFAALVAADTFTAAEIQGYLLLQKRDPEGAVQGAAEWAKDLLEKKRAKEKKNEEEEEKNKEKKNEEKKNNNNEDEKNKEKKNEEKKNNNNEDEKNKEKKNEEEKNNNNEDEKKE